MRIPYFRGIFMRTTLPTGVRRNESGIVNLDNVKGPDTHWTAYAKKRIAQYISTVLVIFRRRN